MPTEIFVALSTFAALLGVFMTVVAYRQRRSETLGKRTEDRIRQIVKDELDQFTKDELDPFTAKQAQILSRLDRLEETQRQLTADVHGQARRTGAILDRVAVLETKIEVFWRSVAMDAAKIIHSPDPDRAHIDALLDSFMAGTMTPVEEIELRAILEVIRDYDPAVAHLTFPVYPGEQIAAAILLRTMGYAMTSKEVRG